MEAVHEQYEGKLPAEIVALWQFEGFCSYGEGLIWVTDPEWFRSVLQEWIDVSRSPVVFARTCWGSLYFWESGTVKLLHVWTGNVVDFGPEPLLLFDYSFTSKSYVERSLMGDVFRQALERLGPLQADECYGFVPAIKLGGDARAANAQKMKIREHLSMLSQL